MFQYHFKAILAKSILVTQVGRLDSDTSIYRQLCYSKVVCVSGGCCLLFLAAGSAGYKTGCKADSVSLLFLGENIWKVKWFEFPFLMEGGGKGGKI